MGDSELDHKEEEERTSIYLECVSCKNMFFCKIRDEKADACLNYEKRGD